MKISTNPSGGTPLPLSDFGIADATLTLRSLAADTLTLLTCEPLTATPVFPFDTPISLFDDNGTRVFCGRVAGISRAAGADSESVNYTVSGPYADLEKLIFEQTWKVGKFTQAEDGAIDEDGQPKPPTFAPEDAGLTRILLGYSLDGSRLPANKILKEILDYAASREILKVGTLSPALLIPPEDVRDRTCHELILKVMQWHPAHTAMFDYSTSPPTFHVRAAGWKAAVLDHTKDLLEIPALTPRYDLQPEGVHITYTRINSATDDNGSPVQATDRIVDKFPATITGQELRTLRFFIDLQGSNATTTAQRVKTELVDVDSIEWWKKMFPDLKDKRVKKLELRSGLLEVKDEAGDYIIAPENTPKHRIVSGAIADWMHKKNLAVRAVAHIKFELKDGAFVQMSEDKTLSLAMQVTNTPTRTFRQTSITPGEAPVMGFAQAFFEQLQELRHEGQIQLNRVEPLFDIPLGAKVTIPSLVAPDGSPYGATLNAVVSGISINLNSGATTLDVGPPAWLTPEEWVEFLRANRNRNPPSTITVSQRKTGTLNGDEADVDKLPDTPGLANSSTANTTVSKTKTGNVTIRNTTISAATGGSGDGTGEGGTTLSMAATQSTLSTVHSVAALDATDDGGTTEPEPDIEVLGSTAETTDDAARPKLQIFSEDIEKDMGVVWSEALGCFIVASEPEGGTGIGGGLGFLMPILTTLPVPEPLPEDYQPVAAWSVTPGLINDAFPSTPGGPVCGESSDPKTWAVAITGAGNIYARVTVDDNYTQCTAYEILFTTATLSSYPNESGQSHRLIGKVFAKGAGWEIVPLNDRNFDVRVVGTNFFWSNLTA